jgi:siroheme synthase
MGLATRAALARRLLERGWPAETPAAIVFAAGHSNAHAWVGRLDALGDAALDDDAAAGTIVVGTVVSLAPLVGSAIQPVQGTLETDGHGTPGTRVGHGSH